LPGYVQYFQFGRIDKLSLFLMVKKNGILAVFHYSSLHKSIYYKNLYTGSKLVNSDKYTDCLIRLPLFYELTDIEVSEIIGCIKEFDKSE